ncbi:tetratricopeptide repeat protein [Flavobacterium sp. NRK F10]|nr:MULTISPECIES: tetratricopeptide repeat protein [Flavobacterium]MCO6174381.1 tetratricopeptide repeat protein [Flavobacterium sp. NRK F10]
MKKIILLLFVVFSLQFSFANLNDAVLKQARDYYKNGNYEKALELYKSYSKDADFSDKKDIYLEMANCYYKLDDTKKAIKCLKTAIAKYGLTEDVFIYSDLIDPEFSKYALAKVYDDLDKLQQEYIAANN